MAALRKVNVIAVIAFALASTPPALALTSTFRWLSGRQGPRFNQSSPSQSHKAPM